jgi:DNA repair protein RecO (recombination protein O)
MATRTQLPTERALVLRCVRYGDADVIAHLFTQESGRRNAMAKGARRQKSSLGTRLEPFTVVEAVLASGRGDLAHIRSADVVAAHDRLRGRYDAQQVAAAAFDMLARVSVEATASEAPFHLTTRLLDLLDAPDGVARERQALLLVAYQLKLLHLTGIAPQLQSCTRCAQTAHLDWWSAVDGGVVCDDCRATADTRLDPIVRGAAAWALQQSLATVATAPDAPTGADAGAVARGIVEPVCAQHAGFRPRTL